MGVLFDGPAGVGSTPTVSVTVYVEETVESVLTGVCPSMGICVHGGKEGAALKGIVLQLSFPPQMISKPSVGLAPGVTSAHDAA